MIDRIYDEPQYRGSGHPTEGNFGSGFKPVWSYRDGGNIVVGMEMPRLPLTLAERREQARLKRLARNPPRYSVAEVLDLMRNGHAVEHEGRMWDARVLYRESA